MNFLKYLYFLLLFVAFGHQLQAQHHTEPSNKPNIIILFADDMGYGDLSSFGHPTIRTPHLDTLAAQGIRFTSYEAAPWCVPSRVELLTGQYMPRVNLNGSTGSDGTGGLPDDVLTLAEGLKEAGYATGMAGKWHLGYKQTKFCQPTRVLIAGLDYLIPMIICRRLCKPMSPWSCIAIPA